MAISNSLGSVSAVLSTFPDGAANRSSLQQARHGTEPLRTAKGGSTAHTRRARAVSARTGFPRTALDTVAHAVKRMVLFRELSLSECGEIAMRARERVFAPGETIFREDDPVGFVYAVASGRVKTIRSNRLGKLIILHLAGPGEVLDGLGLSMGSNHIFTAQAMGRSHVLTWDARVFEEFARRFPTLQSNATRLLFRRLRMTEGRLHELATERVPQRLARVLLRLIVQSERCESRQSLELSCEELAQMAGTTLYTVSRLLCSWAAERIIQPERSAILVENLPGLIHVATQVPTFNEEVG
ncbi:MAG TPA: Crp/Fnr family transcriptional regulator [Candidatus Sulfotelmatobacter sp.]|nr:Crp/Fnr family transcriptional regulator [Candidatus Sulfotelmatobacter sp.]